MKLTNTTAWRFGAAAIASAIISLGSVSAQEMDTLNILVANERSTTFYGMHVALEMGYFADENLEINWLSSSTTIPYVAFLSNGQADLVMFDSAQTMQAVDAEQPFSIIYEDMQFAPEAIYVAEDSDIQSVADLAGKTIGLVSDRDRIIAQVALESAGLTLDDVSTAVVGEAGPTLANAFRRNTVDAVAGSATDLNGIQSAGVLTRDITPPDVAENPANSFAIWNDRKDELRDPVERFLRAWSKGMEAGRLDLQMTAAIMTDAVPEQWQIPEVGYILLELTANKLHEPRSGVRGAIHPELWEAVQPVLVKVGEISQLHDPASFTDDSFIAASNEYTIEALQADVEAWIAANGDRYEALAR